MNWSYKIYEYKDDNNNKLYFKNLDLLLKIFLMKIFGKKLSSWTCIKLISEKIQSLWEEIWLVIRIFVEVYVFKLNFCLISLQILKNKKLNSLRQKKATGKTPWVLLFILKITFLHQLNYKVWETILVLVWCWCLPWNYERLVLFLNVKISKY